MERVARFNASPAVSSTSSSFCLRSTPISATPTMTENRTTAGTMLLASELNGFDGMYRSTKLKAGRRSSSAELKNMALSTSGNASGIRNAYSNAMAQSPPSTAPGAQAQGARLLVAERPEARHNRDRDVGQDGHLQQLDEAVGDPFQDRGGLAEEQADGDAGAQSDENLAGERHVRSSRSRSQSLKILPICMSRGATCSAGLQPCRHGAWQA